MSDTGYLLAVFLVMTVATFLTRVIPFIALKNKGEHPLLMLLGRYMPPSIMTILVIYSLKSVDMMQPPFGANELLALSLTSLVRLLKGHALLSIFSGTAFYMVALQMEL
ncbi:branched-chain amino acid transporter permease [Candidatus Vondammii sp. HM_W22]|uniref:branched-chain amino acid transporter permease n=1 Tax=Candidatus Vondammii sp. HM_W22 TaxID=2687299 RepID=UPI001F1413CA|nr:AzlD domain-containing protein [Candidatus Vondammii sp. HM_W22]